MNKSKYTIVIIFLFIAAILTGINEPLSSILIQNSSPVMIFAFMALGALLFGAVSMLFFRKKVSNNPERKLKKSDFPHLLILSLSALGSGVLTIIGLSLCTSSTVSMVKCLILIITVIFAIILLKEKITRRLWIAIMLITLGGITISTGSIEEIFSSPGVLLVFISCFLTGLVYCYQKKLAVRETGTIIALSQVLPVIGGFIIAFIMGEVLPDTKTILFAVALGIIVYGLSSFFFMKAARVVSVSKCITIVGIAPVIATVISIIAFSNQNPTISLFVSLLLLIPGIWITIKDKETKNKVDEISITKTENPTTPNQYHDVRNYLAAIGLLAFFSYTLLNLLFYLGNYFGFTIEMNSRACCLTVAIILLLIGTALIILRKRDLTGLTLFIYGCVLIASVASENNPVIIYSVGDLLIIFGIVLLLIKERIKFLIFPTVIILALTSLTFLTSPLLATILLTAQAIYVAIMIIFASGLLPKAKLTEILCEDENMKFENTGSFICYVLIAVTVLPKIFQFFLGMEIMPTETISFLGLICGIIIAYMAILMIFVGKNRFMSAIFLGISIFLILSGLTSGVSYYVTGICMILIGLLCILRKDRTYLLLSFMCIVYGISSFAAIPLHNAVVLPVGNLIMSIAIFGVAMYMAIAVLLQNKKLPLF